MDLELKSKSTVEKVHLISLGCPKNRVDSEVMVGQLRSGPFELIDDPDEADVIVVNTCSFIQPATEESIQTVLDMAERKANGNCQKLVVTGCMVQRYGTALESELPEVDFFLGTGEYHKISEVLTQPSNSAGKRSFVDTPLYIHDEFSEHLPSWKPHSAYLKISEGCNHRCSFCIIPTLRGKLRSRTQGSLVAEATRLARQGVVELNIVSQDSTAYGRDLKDGSDLGTLLRALCAVEGIEWIRLHYAYPIGLPESLLRAIAEEPKICTYIDIPLQHASGPMLKAMRRGVTRSGQERILDRIQSFVPNATIRTTFIVGFPGETDADFDVLCDFVSAKRFDRVGVFTYHPEEGTDAATLGQQVSEDIKEQRRDQLMRLQAQISKERLERFLDTEQVVLVDGFSEEHDWIRVGRMADQAPEVDGLVYLDEAPEELKAGMFCLVEIQQVSEYDMVGRFIKILSSPHRNA